jgi:hypothetical protein
MTSHERTMGRTGLGRRLLLMIAGLGVAAALLFSQHGTARADNGFYRQGSWNWAYTTPWNWNWDRTQQWNWNWTHWDDDWYASRGAWGNHGLWYGHKWYNGTPVIYTFNKPVYLPHYGKWVVFHNNRPVLSTPHRPIYRPIGNVYVIVNATGHANVNIDIDINAHDDFNYVYWRY